MAKATKQFTFRATPDLSALIETFIAKNKDRSQSELCQIGVWALIDMTDEERDETLMRYRHMLRGAAEEKSRTATESQKRRDRAAG